MARRKPKGIVNLGHEDVEIGHLKHHPQNVNEGDIDAIVESIERNGFFGSVLVNKRTNHILAGNHRVLAAKRLGFITVPVTWVDVSEEEELRILLVDNRTARLGVDNIEGLVSLLEELAETDAGLIGTGYADYDLDDLLLSMEPEEEKPSKKDKKERQQEEAEEDDVEPWHFEHAVYPSDNEFGIPSLDPKLQARTLTPPVEKWGYISRKAKFNGTYQFYTDDYKFSAVWTDPTTLVNSKCIAITELNYSTHNQMPIAVFLYDLYKKRWISRYCQSYGIQIFVDVNVEEVFYPYCLLGVPKGWGSYAVRANVTADKGTDVLQSAVDLARKHAGDTPLVMLVFGGGKVAQEFCRQTPGLFWVAENSEVKTGRRKSEIHHDHKAQADDEEIAEEDAQGVTDEAFDA